MRKLAVSTFILAVAVTLPLQARGKNESYISYDDGGTVVRQGDDNNREIDARVNLPVFPGDELITNRRGRAEVRLADGNIVGIDRASSIFFRSVLNSYDTEGNDTVAELRYGKVAVLRTGDAQQSFRLDTPSASYFAGNEAIFSVETDSRGKDHLTVFDGPVEVRTPAKTSRVRAGESADIDDRGLYNLVSDEQASADDFERWFLQRSEKYGNANSRYLDRTIAYSDDDLASHGTWTFMSGFGWGWRPYVSAGWRPYYYGQWASGPSGCLTWVSYEPWGWVPYHYGRWAFDPMYGWFWLPGAAYSPAWVYWMYSPGYIGWAPAGWYDCYRPYYDWAYRPYARAGFDFGFGFSGRVRVNEVDLRPWTFVDANTIISGRVDRAAIGADIVRARITRAPADLAWVSGSPARFGRNDLRDPAGAVNEIYRRGLTGATGQVLPSTDMTSFFRREPALPAQVRDRIVRARPGDGVVGTAGSLAPIGSGSVAPIGRGSVAPIGSGSVAPTTGGTGGNVHRGDGGTWRNNGSGSTGGSNAGGSNTGSRDSGSGRINRGGSTGGSNTGGSTTGGTNSGSRDGGSGRVNRGSEPKHEEVTPAPAPVWRNRIIRGTPGATEPVDRPATPPPSSSTTPRGDSWRGRATTDPAPADSTPAPAAPSGRSRSVDRGTSDIPRRIIDGIGGTRIYRGEGTSTPPPRTPESKPAPAPQHQSPPPPPPEHRDSGSHSDGGKVHRDKQ